MNAETFLNQFGHLADAPNGVQKLRELVLQLAVRGRLAGKLSPDWNTVLSALGEWANGSGFPKEIQGVVDADILVCKVSDMNLPGNEKYINSTANTLTIDSARSARIKVHPVGTVVFPKIGGAIATNKRRVLIRPTAIDNNCLGIVPSQHCSTDWLYLVLRSIDFTTYQAGTSVPALNQSAISGIPVTLPPLAEQHRIVAKVDELLALCDELEDLLRKRESTRDRLLSAVISALLTSPLP